MTDHILLLYMYDKNVFLYSNAFHVHLFLVDTCSRSFRALAVITIKVIFYLSLEFARRTPSLGRVGVRIAVAGEAWSHTDSSFLSRFCRSGSFYQSHGPGCNLEWVFLLHCVHQCCLSGARPTVVPRYDRTGTGQGTSLSCLAIDD